MQNAYHIIIAQSPSGLVHRVDRVHDHTAKRYRRHMLSLQLSSG